MCPMDLSHLPVGQFVRMQHLENLSTDFVSFYWWILLIVLIICANMQQTELLYSKFYNREYLQHIQTLQLLTVQ